MVRGVTGVVCGAVRTLPQSISSVCVSALKAHCAAAGNCGHQKMPRARSCTSNVPPDQAKLYRPVGSAVIFLASSSADHRPKAYPKYAVAGLGGLTASQTPGDLGKEDRDGQPGGRNRPSYISALHTDMPTVGSYRARLPPTTAGEVQNGTVLGEVRAGGSASMPSCCSHSLRVTQ